MARVILTPGELDALRLIAGRHPAPVIPSGIVASLIMRGLVEAAGGRMTLTRTGEEILAGSRAKRR